VAGLIPIEQAQARLLALAAPLAVETVPLIDAAGRFLAEPLIARRDQPYADLSAMDGYALTGGDGPWRVTHAIPAESRDPGRLAAGEAARIFTGAPLPAGADRVLMQEDAQLAGVLLSTAAASPQGQFVRPRGSDFTAGAILAATGQRISPALIALAAMAGHGALPCRRLPHVGLLATGSELVVPGDADAGRTPSSNTPMLAALLADAAQVHDLGIAPDDLDATRAALLAGAAHDLIIVTGGASVGDHDLVKPALVAEGWTIALHRIAMKPGKPLVVAHRDGRLMLGLPGNPVSAYVTALLFALPVLRALTGAAEPLPRHEFLPLAAPLPAGGSRVEYLRARRHGAGVIAAGSRDSAALSALAAADVLIRLDIDAPPQPAGTLVPVIALA
jgi:molybdopterin molybdotransferase